MQAYLITSILLAFYIVGAVSQDPLHKWANVSYIVGGSPVAEGEVPWAAALYSGEGFCGGSIITKRTILTAAHCINGVTASQIKVRIGSLRHSTGGTQLNVSKVVVHQSWNPNISYDNDIGVLILSSDIPIDGRNVGAVNLANASTEPVVGSMSKVVGWGVSVENGTLADLLMKVEVPIVTRNNCNSTYQALPRPINITLKMICAGYESGGKDACQGDSGGPLTQGSTQVGVVSFGHGCARTKYPNVYANIGSFRSWIDMNKV